MKNVFHKYRTDSEFTESIIKSGKIYLATAHQLNDPFECSFKDISNEWMNERIKEGMQASLAGFVVEASRAIKKGETFFGLAPLAAQSEVELIGSAGNLESSYEAWRSFMLKHTGHPPSDIRVLFYKLDDQLVQTGIFSMSSDPAQALMWAHYADQHRGLCLGFRQVRGSKLDDPDHCLPVIYSDTLPSMEGQGLKTVMTMAMDEKGRMYTSSLKLSFKDETFKRIVTTKPTSWSYEQEIRYVEPFGGLADWPGELAECTFGLKCSEDRRRKYIDLLESYVPNDVSLFEIRIINGTNSLERVPLAASSTQSRIPGRDRKHSNDLELLSLEEFAARIEQLIQRERYGEAISQIDENISNGGSAPQLLHLKAVALGLSHEHERAYECFRSLRDLHPEVAAGWYGMGCALQGLERAEGGSPVIRKSIRVKPG